MHILGAIFWAGGMVLMHGFIFPSIEATRPESTRFVQDLTGKRNLPLFMTLASVATVIGGLGLFGPATGMFDHDMMRAPHGIALSIGAVLALSAFIEGMIVTGPSAGKIGAIGKEIAASGKGPTPEQIQKMEALQTKMKKVGMRGTVLVVLAALLMAIARYL